MRFNPIGSACLSLSALLLTSPVIAERARSPERGTVFIRVIGTVRVTVEDAFEERREERNVELGTGSGFVFTEYGHVLTNHHVIEGGTTTRQVGSANVESVLSVDRIEISLPRSGERWDAVVEAVDPTRDLAVLAVVGEIAYLPLGDSEASGQGDGVRVYGFPFGAEVEVGKTASNVVPSVSSSAGSLSAKRLDDEGGAAYLQTSAVVNPGNSGGPLVDEDGYVIGVVRSKLRDADGVGFAIPVNEVKQFLTLNGYDPMLPVPALTLGAELALEDKGVSVRVPDTMEDVSTSRLRVMSDPSLSRIAFSSERVYTPWTAAEIEQAYLGGLFGSFAADAAGPDAIAVPSAAGVLSGRVHGRDPVTGAQRTAAYALVEMGDEKLLARYEGAPDAMAFNRSVVEGSLESLQVSSLLSRPLSSEILSETEDWSLTPLPSPAAPSVSLPTSWNDEVSAPFPCDGLPPVESAVATSPSGDFTVSLRVGWWSALYDPLATAGACGAPEGNDRYAYTIDWLGVRYVVEGVILNDSGTLQLEVVAPQAKHGFVRALARDWMERARP